MSLDSANPDLRRVGTLGGLQLLRSAEWGFPRAAWVALAGGLGLRAAQYRTGRSLWLDEAMLALNVLARPASALFERLDYAQTAPPLFLLAEQAAVAVFGVNEFALRLLPFVCSLLLLYAVWEAARRITAREEAAFAVVLAALSPLLLRYATELKPYASDALACAALVGLTVWLLEAPEEQRRWRWVQGAGAGALWASIPVTFVLAGAGLALATERLRGRTGVSWARLLTTAAVWGASAGGVYRLVLRHSAGDPFLRWYFEEAFLAPDARNLVGRVSSAALVLSQVFFHRGLLAEQVPVVRQAAIVLVAVLLGVGGAVIFRRRGPAVLVLLVAPVAAAALASAVRAYPFTPRTLAFTVPLLLILVAVGFGAATAYLNRWTRCVIAAAFVASAVAHDVKEAQRPTTGRDEARDVIRAALRDARPYEPVYVSPYAIPQWVLYSTDWAAPDTVRLNVYRHLARSPDGPALQARPTRGHPARAEEVIGLTYQHAARLELLGLFSGESTRARPPASSTSSPSAWGATADSGWATLEAQRLRLVANPCVLLLGPLLRPQGALTRALHDAGGQLEVTPPTPGVTRTRVCF